MRISGDRPMASVTALIVGSWIEAPLDAKMVRIGEVIGVGGRAGRVLVERPVASWQLGIVTRPPICTFSGTVGITHGYVSRSRRWTRRRGTQLSDNRFCKALPRGSVVKGRRCLSAECEGVLAKSHIHLSVPVLRTWAGVVRRVTHRNRGFVGNRWESLPLRVERRFGQRCSGPRNDRQVDDDVVGKIKWGARGHRGTDHSQLAAAPGSSPPGPLLGRRLSAPSWLSAAWWSVNGLVAKALDKSICR